MAITNFWSSLASRTATLAGLAALFLITGAPGGGFGGGRGSSFSGTRSYSSGSSYRSSSSSSSSSSYRAYNSSSPQVIVVHSNAYQRGNSYYNSGNYSRGSNGSGNTSIFWFLMGSLGVVGAGYGLYRFLNRRPALFRNYASTFEESAAAPMYVVSVGLLLRDSDLASRFDSLIKNTDFREPQYRLAALEHFITLTRSADQVDGYFDISEVVYTPMDASDRAEVLVNRQVKRVDLKPETVNLARDGFIVEKSQEAQTPSPVSATAETYCFVGFTASITKHVVAALKDGNGAAAAQSAMSHMRTMSARYMDSFYLFYSPAVGETLTELAGRQMLTDVRELARHA